MTEAKPFASLSSGLLARKGAAKPAMRRPNFNSNPDNLSENGQDDLGWNDMGYDVDPDISQEAPIEKSAVNPLANAVETPKPEVKQQQERIAAQLQASVEKEEHVEAEVPSVEPVALHSKNNDFSQSDDAPELQNVDINENIEKPEASPVAQKPLLAQKPFEKSADIIKAPRKKPVAAKKVGTGKSRAAFTLRLDPERHLKLRLACAINNISAQKFVTDALDQKLNEMEQIDLLSDQIAENK